MKIKLRELILVLIISSALAFTSMMPIVFPAVTSTQTTTSNVTVNVLVSIGLQNATGFGGGLMFGSLEMNTTDNPTVTCAGYGCNITVSADTNTAVDIKIKDNLALTSGANNIPNSGYTWNSTDATSMPESGGSFAIGTSYDATNKVGASVAAGGKRTWQAWLDIPNGQAAGNYNNTISFCSEIAGGTACT